MCGLPLVYEWRRKRWRHGHQTRLDKNAKKPLLQFRQTLNFQHVIKISKAITHWMISYQKASAWALITAAISINPHEGQRVTGVRGWLWLGQKWADVKVSFLKCIIKVPDRGDVVSALHSSYLAEKTFSICWYTKPSLFSSPASQSCHIYEVNKFQSLRNDWLNKWLPMHLHSEN